MLSAWLEDALARALEANERWERLAGELRAERRLRAENERLRARDAQRDAELERVNAALAVLQRMLFGRSSERARPERRAGMTIAAGTRAGIAGTAVRAAGRAGRGRGPGGGITRICPGSR